MNKKEFREFLNKNFGNYKDYRKRFNTHTRIKRPYGDYLWYNDRDIFNDMFERQEEYIRKFNKEGSKMKDWKKVLRNPVFGESYNRTKSDIDTGEDFEFYKNEDGVEYQNRGKFTGNKFPRSGDPAKVELNTWHAQNKEYEKAKKREDKGDEFGSPIVSEEGRYENVDEKIKDKNVIPDLMGGKIKHDASWRKVLSDVQVEKKPDGSIKVNVDENTNAPMEYTQGIPPEGGQEIQQEQSTEEVKQASKVDEWEIKKEGSLKLVGRECKDCAGIAITKDGKDLESYKIEKEGHLWDELIPVGAWESKFQNYL